jgi:hypothetical protein
MKGGGMKGGVASQDSRKCGLIFGRVVDDKRVMARALRVLVPGAWMKGGGSRLKIQEMWLDIRESSG